ncbi:hypothetical protein OSB04_005542 [Centaurea solstitialis]|uniref:J domain-containing protein n=1 Tax=Centaurea solstitialis TaxID=347529 RepID=A0AA38TZD4_9ASTR|nr:hypothetical protein OSB04_005542 [Centaurea solstitialis]
MQATSRAEAERLLQIAEKLLEENDLNAARDFALLAQETDPLLDASDRIMAIADVLIAAANHHHHHHHHYAILQIDDIHRRNHDSDIIKQQYRRLALLLHPDDNKFPLAGSAFKLVEDAWDVLSDPAKKELYDRKLFESLKVDPDGMRNRKEKEDRNSVIQCMTRPTQGLGLDTLRALKMTQLGIEWNPIHSLPGRFKCELIFYCQRGTDKIASHGNLNQHLSFIQTLNALLRPDTSLLGLNIVMRCNHYTLTVKDEFTFERDPIYTVLRKTNLAKHDLYSGEKMMPERRNSGEEGAAEAENIWTPCPYCYNLFEYPRVFDGYCLRCANCERAFQAVAIPPESMPPLVPGKEAYYFCSPAFSPIWMQPVVSKQVTSLPSSENTVRPSESRPMPEPEKKPASPANGGSATRKRGRPTKNPLL